MSDSKIDASKQLLSEYASQVADFRGECSTVLNQGVKDVDSLKKKLIAKLLW